MSEERIVFSGDHLILQGVKRVSLFEIDIEGTKQEMGRS